MTDKEIASAMQPKSSVERIFDSLSGMADVSPGVRVVARSIDLNRPSSDYEKDVCEPKTAYVLGISVDF